jgi:hypothetical protein
MERGDLVFIAAALALVAVLVASVAVGVATVGWSRFLVTAGAVALGLGVLVIGLTRSGRTT